MSRALGELLAIDPSIASVGVAMFRDGVLVAAAPIKIKADAKRMIGARCLSMAEAIVEYVAREKFRPRVLAFEWPQVYPGPKAKGDPNDLPPMAGVGMAVAGILSLVSAARHEKLEILSYKPREWTQLPKDKRTKAAASMSPRARRIMGKLSNAELGLDRWRTPDPIGSPFSSHDAIDAIGIGLYALGRLEPERVFPGADGGPPIH